MKVYIACLSDIENNPGLLDGYQASLSADEKDRYQNMTNDSRRLQFLLGRALIREACRQSPTLLSNGKPIVEKGYISLAHSGPYVVLAVDDEPVGVDIEDSSKNKDFPRLAKRLNFQLTDDIRGSFYRQFTQYEATYKIAVSDRPLYHNFYLIDTFILCITSLNKKEKIEFVKTIPFVQKVPFTPTYLETEATDDLS